MSLHVQLSLFLADGDHRLTTDGVDKTRTT